DRQASWRKRLRSPPVLPRVLFACLPLRQARPPENRSRRFRTCRFRVENTRLRAELRRQYERNANELVNVLGMVAAEAAYTHGEAWLEEMLVYLRGNHAHFAKTINEADTRLK